MEKRVLITRWLESCGEALPIYDVASVSSARQRVREVGAAVNAGDALTESVALIASELTHNQLAHSRQGYFCVKAIERRGVRGLEVLAADMGPGLQKPILSGAQPAGFRRIDVLVLRARAVVAALRVNCAKPPLTPLFHHGFRGRST